MSYVKCLVGYLYRKHLSHIFASVFIFKLTQKGGGYNNSKHFCFKILIITFDFGVDKGAQFKSRRDIDTYKLA